MSHNVNRSPASLPLLFTPPAELQRTVVCAQVREYPLSQTYVDVCLEGCLQYGTAFALRWLQAIRGCPTLEGQSAHG